MPVECPSCGSRFLRESEPRDEAERRGRWRLVSPLRCLDCQERFVARTLNLSDFRFAHCPKCDRVDLNQWSGKTFEPPFWTSLAVTFGAHRWRCEYCRINFASFRPRNEIFSFKRFQKMHPPGTVAAGRARVARLETEAEEAREIATKKPVGLENN